MPAFPAGGRLRPRVRDPLFLRFVLVDRHRLWNHRAAGEHWLLSESGPLRERLDVPTGVMHDRRVAGAELYRFDEFLLAEGILGPDVEVRDLPFGRELDHDRHLDHEVRHSLGVGPPFGKIG